VLDWGYLVKTSLFLIPHLPSDWITILDSFFSPKIEYLKMQAFQS